MGYLRTYTTDVCVERNKRMREEIHKSYKEKWGFLVSTKGKEPACQCRKVKSESEVTQSCLTLCDPMDCSMPVSSIHGIFQARVLEWGAIAFSQGWGTLTNEKCN